MRNFQLLNSQIDASAMLIPQQQINGGETVVSDMEGKSRSTSELVSLSGGLFLMV